MSRSQQLKAAKRRRQLTNAAKREAKAKKRAWRKPSAFRFWRGKVPINPAHLEFGMRVHAKR